MSDRPGGTLEDTLHARGYRLTEPRRLVLEAVAALGHATPDEIADEVRRRGPSVNLSTVYRTLDLLSDLGLVGHSHLGHGPATYHVTGHDDHVHLVCRACGEVDSIPRGEFARLAGDLRADHGFEIDLGHLALFGRCRSCGGSAAGA